MFAAVGLQDTVETDDLHGVLGGRCILFQVAGKPAIAVGLCPEGCLDPPAQRQRCEALGITGSGRDIDDHIMAFGRRIHAVAGVDAVHLDPLGRPPSSAAWSSTIPAALVSCTFAAVTSTASTKPSEQVRIWRLIPFTRLLPSTPRTPFCGPDTTLCESRMVVDGSAAWPRS